MKMYERFEPYKVRVQRDETVAICQCGESSDPPFCTGNHDKTGKKPFLHKATKDENLFACGCGNSITMPWCDGAHKTCPENENFKNRW
ncbi:CDGSH iron-sulfur domain-containing protein [Magnetococcales bacterium HHB-1]